MSANTGRSWVMVLLLWTEEGSVLGFYSLETDVLRMETSRKKVCYKRDTYDYGIVIGAVNGVDTVSISENNRPRNDMVQ